MSSWTVNDWRFGWRYMPYHCAALHWRYTPPILQITYPLYSRRYLINGLAEYVNTRWRYSCTNTGVWKLGLGVVFVVVLNSL
jgi:hypothetical protein